MSLDSTVVFSDLNDDCIRLVFARLSLQTQIIRLQLVCKRWKCFVDENCHAKRALKLFDGDSAVYSYCKTLLEHNREQDPLLALKPIGTDDDLILANGIRRPDPIFSGPRAAEFIAFLASRFPLIEHLVLCFKRLESGTLLAELSKSIAFLKLKTVTIFDEMGFRESIELNLTLPKRIHMYEVFATNVISLPPREIFDNMDSLTLWNDDQDDALTHLLAGGVNLRNLGSRYNEFKVDYLRHTTNDLPESARVLTHLKVEIQKLESLKLICQLFTALTYLEINFENMNICYFTDCLSELKRLEEVRFSRFETNSELIKEKHPLPLPTVSRVSIHNLKLNLNDSRQTRSEYSYQLSVLFGCIFPNVPLIHIRCDNVSQLSAALFGVNTQTFPSKSAHSYDRFYIYSASTELKHAGRHRRMCLEKQQESNDSWPR